MSQTKPPILELASFIETLKRHPLRWVVPALLIAGLTAAYVVVRTPKWESSQALLVRDEAVGNLHRLGQFDSVDSMKTAQETILELAKSRSVAKAALRQISTSQSTQPSNAEVGELQEAIQVTAPNGAEFGRTEVFYLKVKDSNPQRAIALTQAVCEQLDKRLRELRNTKAQSLIDELRTTVGLARADLDRTTEQLSKLEKKVGSDLAELRILNESAAGESNMRQTLIEVKKELGSARVAKRVNLRLLEMLRAGQDNPKGLVATPSLLLQSQPTLQQIKNGLVAARIYTAQLLGECTPEHPRVQAARATEEEISRHLQAEMTRTIVALEADCQLGNARIESLVEQQNDIEHRMRDIVSLRAGYDNLVKEVQKRTAILNDSQGQLSDARASQMAAAAASLITMLDGPATPNSPVGPSNSMVLACGIFGGLFAGFGVVLLTVPVVGDAKELTNATEAADCPSEQSQRESRGLNLRQAISRIEQLTPSNN